MAVCRHCGREFRRGEQAVRAHLRTCPEYVPKVRRPIGSLPIGSMPIGFTEPGVEEPATDQELAIQDRERMRDLARQEAREGLRKSEEEKQALQRKRRDLVQQVKHAAMTGWSPPYPYLAPPTELEAEGLLQIERQLSALPIDEIPKQELIEIAQGIRDRVYRPYFERQKERHKLEAQKRAFVRLGREYAEEQLKLAELDYFEQQDVLKAIEETLEDEVTGEERRAEVRDLVDEILDDELEWNEST